ncbi:MAG: Holliday junction resolvase [Bacteroidetes bacterium]|nr:Holliday junction resolvase [Bacteroidota bacterium]
MAKQVLTIPIELPDFNSLIKSSKSHWSKYAEIKKGYDSIVSSFAMRELKPITKYPIDITCNWYCKDDKKDKDNISAGKKFILDGLKLANIIPDDTWQYIGNFSDKFFVDRSNPRIEVVLKY